MERLTYKDECGYHLKVEHEDADTVEALGRYEDIGLGPGELKRVFNEEAILKLAGQALGVMPDRLRELAKADKDGRLVVLPCKTVYIPTWDAGKECDLVCPVSIDGEGCCDFCDKAEQFIYEKPCRQEHIEQIGKTVFLTREEAKAALAAQEGDSHEADPV